MLLPIGVASARTNRLALTYSCVSPHCYGLAHFHTPAFNFAGAQTANTVRGIGTGDGFLTNEIWLVDDTTYPGSVYWIEVGYGVGLNIVSSVCTSAESYFWADQRPNGGGFYIHCPQVPTSGDYGWGVQDSIWQYNTCSTTLLGTITTHSSPQINPQT